MWILGLEHMSPSQDVALPLMRDPRWEPDTLFLVFEEDFRFEEHEEGVGEPTFMKAKGLQEVVGEVDELETERPRVPLNFTNAAASLLLCVFFFAATKQQGKSLPLLPVCVHVNTAVEPTATAVTQHACEHTCSPANIAYMFAVIVTTIVQGMHFVHARQAIL